MFRGKFYQLIFSKNIQIKDFGKKMNTSVC